MNIRAECGADIYFLPTCHTPYGVPRELELLRHHLHNKLEKPIQNTTSPSCVLECKIDKLGMNIKSNQNLLQSKKYAEFS